MRLRSFVLFGLLAVVASAKPHLGFAFVQSSKLAPNEFAHVNSGTFGLPLILEPVWRFYPQPTIPKALRKELREGVARAALRVGKDGSVTDVKLLEATPEGIVEESALKFFRRVVYQPQKQDGRAIEFETDAVLLFIVKDRKAK